MTKNYLSNIYMYPNYELLAAIWFYYRNNASCIIFLCAPCISSQVCRTFLSARVLRFSRFYTFPSLGIFRPFPNLKHFHIFYVLLYVFWYFLAFLPDYYILNRFIYVLTTYSTFSVLLLRVHNLQRFLKWPTTLVAVPEMTCKVHTFLHLP